MMSEFIQNHLNKARYKILKDGSYFGEIPGAKGVWANRDNLKDCREELREVVEDWVLLRVREHETVSAIKVGATHQQGH